MFCFKFFPCHGFNNYIDSCLADWQDGVCMYRVCERGAVWAVFYNTELVETELSILHQDLIECV